jgi:hypothetical protein
MPKQHTTPAPEGAGTAAEATPRPVYRVGEVIVFKYEGNVRAEVTGHQAIGGRVWVEARAADLQFLVPAHQVVGVEPKEVA